MKQFKFEVIIYDVDVEGDEFWEEAISRDGTGIGHLTDALIEALEDSNLMVASDRNPKDAISLKSYKDTQ